MKFHIICSVDIFFSEDRDLSHLHLCHDLRLEELIGLEFFVVSTEKRVRIIIKIGFYVPLFYLTVGIKSESECHESRINFPRR